MKACLRAERAAQRQLYESYKQPLYRLCLRYARDQQEAEDFLHEAFIRIFRDLHQYSGKGALGGWLRRVCLNCCLQHIRKRGQVIFSDNMTVLVDAADQVDDLPPSPHDMQQLLQVIQELPAGYRTVFNLFVVENYSHQEIADALSISVGSSKSQLSKAKAMLRRRLAAKAVS